MDSWFFIYFGYSFEEKRAFGYVKFQDRTETVSFNDHRHFVPKYFRVFLAKDPWHKAFNGQMRGFKFCAGTSCFRDSNMHELESQYEVERASSEVVSRLVAQHDSFLQPHDESILPEAIVFDE